MRRSGEWWEGVAGRTLGVVVVVRRGLVVVLVLLVVVVVVKIDSQGYRRRHTPRKGGPVQNNLI